MTLLSWLRSSHGPDLEPVKELARIVWRRGKRPLGVATGFLCLGFYFGGWQYFVLAGSWLLLSLAASAAGEFAETALELLQAENDRLNRELFRAQAKHAESWSDEQEREGE